MAIPQWEFILTDLQGSVLGEVLNANNKQVVLPLDRLPTASFQIPIQHPLAPYFASTTFDGLLKCYRDNVLRFCGPIVSGAEAFDEQNGQTIAVNAAGAMWRLKFRYLGTTNIGWAFGDQVTQYDLGYIAQQMLASANTTSYTGISPGTLESSENGSAGTYYFKPVADAIVELSIGLNSFDFEVAPVEPTDIGLGWPRIGYLNCASLLGTSKQGVIFEYGTSKANVASYSRQTERSSMCTTGFMQQPAVSDHTGILSTTSASAEAARGRFEALIDDGGVQWNTLRQVILNENIAVRKQPRQVVNFMPVMNASPTAFTDFIVGDQIRARISVNNINILDAMLRCYGITFDIDKEGNERMTLELIPPTSSTL